MSFPIQFDNDHQVIVSLELLKLLHWLIEHEQEVLKRLIKKALDQNALNERDSFFTLHEHMQHEQIQDEVGNIFMLLETLLHEVSSEDTEALALQRLLIPALDQIDTTQCSQEMISKSIAKAAAYTEKKDQESTTPQEVLYKELLKQWQPPKSVN